jgi:hypothetical protein
MPAAADWQQPTPNPPVPLWAQNPAVPAPAQPQPPQPPQAPQFPQPQPPQPQLPMPMPMPMPFQPPGALPQVQPGQQLQPVQPGQLNPYAAPGAPAQYEMPGMASGAYLYPLPGQAPEFGAAPARPRRKVSKWVVFGVPGLVVAIVAGVLVALNLPNPLNPAVTKVVCSPGNLTSCLIAPPAGASVGTTTWAGSTAVDANAYAAAYTDSAASQQPAQVGSLLNGDGVKGIAHRSWIQGSNEIDLILLQFNSPQGAQAWADDRTGEFLSLDAGPQLSVPGVPGKAYSATTTDSSGYVDARYVTTIGNMDIEAHYGSKNTMQQQDLNIWLAGEYGSLQNVTFPAPTPSPTATQFQTAVCQPGKLAPCLMPLPPGAQTLPGVPSSYDNTSFTNDFITQADAAAIKQRMVDDNVLQISSESWGTNGFADGAQLILIQTRTDSQAQDLAQHIGGDAAYSNSFSVPGYAGAVANYSSSADAQGFYEGLVSYQLGTVYMTLWLNFANSFDTATAQSWAVDALNVVTQNVLNNWGFPIPQVSTPSLAAFTPGTCASSGVVGCMMPVPSGASAGSTAGGATVRDIGISDYVNSVYSDRQGYEQAWLTSDGANDAATESWTASDGATATDYIVSFGSSRQAEAAALQEAGDSVAGSQSCSVLSLPNLYCMVLPADTSNGFVPIKITAWSGKYELDLEVTKPDAADTTDALTWAQAQLQLLAGG